MTEPRADRPHMPNYGLETSAPLLDWPWARYRLRRSRDYWIATVRPSGAPHLMKVWGEWRDDDTFAFSSDPASTKVRNLVGEPRCSVATEDVDDLVVVEGRVRELRADELDAFLAHYNVKYDALDPGWGELSADFGPFWVVEPVVAFGCVETDHRFTQTMTRWNFT